jgi:hypothetical protein
VLNDQDLIVELTEYLSKERAHYHFAFYGTRAQSTQLNIEGHGEYHVQPVRCELELRERFAELGVLPRVAWLVPYRGQVPYDLRHCFAKDGTVRTVGASARLRRLFGVLALEPGLESGPLAQWLAQQPEPEDGRLKVNAQRLSKNAMWSSWFASETGIAGLSELSASEWLLRCAQHGDAPSFARRLKEHATGKAVLDALRDHLSERLGPLAAAVLDVFCAGQAARLLHLGIVSSALLEAQDAGARMWLTLKLKAIGFTESGLLDALRLAADQTVHELVRHRSERDALLRAAESESVVDEPEVRLHLARHLWLSAGFRARLDTLGAALQSALAKLDLTSFQRAVDADAALALHHRYEDYARDADRARMAVRLLGFLQRATELRRALPLSDSDAALALARWYSQEGGYVDLARQEARSSDDHAFGRAVRDVVSKVDELRRELDRRFARGLAAWIGAGLPRAPVLPIQRALGHMLEAALKGQRERRALVLLMDGMGWAECTALLRSAAESPAGLLPLRLNRELSRAAGVAAESVYALPVLAAIPTLTKVSRTAFFAGELPPSSREPSSSEDPRRFAAHPVVTELNDGRPARLLLRAEGHNTDGHLSDEARTLIRDRNERIVGLVVNAIDASLKADAQQQHVWNMHTVLSLQDIFDEARRAGRSVLFASDHGHVRSAELHKGTVPDRVVLGGERWRGAAADESHGSLLEAQPGAPITFAGPHVWAPPGARAVTVFSDERGRHALQPHAGEHGGATLAEVVAPCLWLGAPEPEYEGTPLETQALQVPDWWLLRPLSAATSGPAQRTSTRPVAGSGTRARSKRPPPVAHAHGSLAAALGANDLFKARALNDALRERTLTAIAFLEQRDGIASLDDLADAVGVARYRIDGLVSQMQRALNVDGEPILERPSEADHVRLNAELLRQQFEVER